MAKKAVTKKTTKSQKNTKTKRKVSGKRGSPSRKTYGRDGGVDPRGVIGVAVFGLGLLALACQFIPSSGGWLNSCMLFVRGLGGTLCLLLPLVVCWAGVTLVFFESRRLSLRTMICGLLLFLFAETFFQLFQVNLITSSLLADGKAANYIGFMSRSFQYDAFSCSGGGFIGAILAWPLVKAFDVWGSIIVLIIACTMVLMVLTGVSFGEVGMTLSQLLDDWRVRLRERREEHEALLAKQEEEALEEERVIAQQRQKKREERERAEREAQKRREADQAARKAPEDAYEGAHAEADQGLYEDAHQDVYQDAYQGGYQDAPQGDAPVQMKTAKKKKKARTAPLESEEDLSLPLFEQNTPARKMPVRKGASSDATLYIERSDEFERVSIDEHPAAQGRRRRANFTVEEAEYEFLNGIGAQAPKEERPRHETGYASQYGDYTPHPAYAPQREAAQPVNEQQADLPWQDPLDAYAPTEAYDEPQAFEPYEAEMTQDDDDSAMQSVQESAASPVQAAPVQRRAQVVHEPDEAFSPFSAGSYTKPSSIPARPDYGRRADGDSPSEAPSPDWAPMRNARPEEFRPVGAQQEEKTIVQLRGNRLDGTPLVVPKKDTHEGPKAMEEAYMYPPIDLLKRSSSAQDPNANAKIEAGARKLLSTLESFGVQAKLTHVTRGPAITRYELQPAPGVKVSRIVNLVDDIALNMASDGVRIEAPIPGKPAVGIEIPNEKIEMVSLRDVLESSEMTREKSPTAVALGKGISGAPVVADMAKMPHVLIAGATGSGKSVCINTIINSIIYRASPKEVRLILIDPKVVELSVYNGIPHLLVPVVTDPKKASAALSWAVVEMEHRYKRFETMGVRNIKGYNDAIGPDEEPMSKIIVIIDELADLMMVAPGEVEESICRLAQLARAAGIHLVIATQRPSVNVITGVIKANIPSRIAFAVSSQIDSRTILDSGGAEKLLGKGDMLYAPQGAGKPTRVQGCFVSDEEVQRIVDYVRGQHSADYNEDVIEQMNSAAEEEKAASGDAPAGGEPVDEMLAKAIDLAVEAGQVSISMLQRRLRVGYARAGRLVDEMTLRGIAGEAEGPTKPRTVLISREEWRRMQENQE